LGEYNKEEKIERREPMGRRDERGAPGGKVVLDRKKKSGETTRGNINEKGMRGYHARHPTYINTF